jgi:hypothetical protein
MKVFDTPTLASLATRLFGHAAAAHQMEVDIHLAAKVCSNLAALRLEVAEIAAKTKDRDTARELRDALRDAEL